MMHSGNSRQLAVTRMQNWEEKQEPDHSGLIHNFPAKESQLYSMGNKASLKGNDGIGFALRTFSLDVVERRLEQCFPTLFTSWHTQT